MRARMVTIILALTLTATACAGDAPDTQTETPTANATPEATETATEGEVDEAALERIATAAQQTVTDGTANFTITAETTGTQGEDGRQPITVDGAVDFDEELRRLTFEGPQGELEIVVEGTMAYIEMPATEDEQWVRLDLDALNAGDLGFGGPAGLPFQNPRENLEILERAATSVSEAGDEDIDGTEATRYDVTIDVGEASDEADDEARQALDESIRRTGVTHVEMSVWIDEDDRIQRVSYTLDLGQAEVEEEGVGADPSGEVTIIVDYRDHGEPVDIDIPDEDQVVDLDEEEIRRTFGSD